MSDRTLSGRNFAAILTQARRARGLSQMALGHHAGISQKHISFLETGRSQPGRDVVERLALGLQLSTIEAEVFLAAAGYAPALQDADRALLEAARSAVSTVMEQQNPYPAILVDTAQNILSSNTSFDRLIAFLDPEQQMISAIGGSPNLLKMFLHAEGLFPLIINPRQLVSSVLQRVIREARGDPEAHALVQEILEWPHIRRLRISSVPEIDTAVVYEERYSIGGDEIALICLITSIGAPGSAAAERMRLEMFHPVDAASDSAIRRITT